MRRRISRRDKRRSTASSTEPTSLKVDVTRAIDKELSWYFAYAEHAARLGTPSLLPAYLVQMAVAESEEEQSVRAKALVERISVVLRAVPTQHASVLRAVYTPRRWPPSVAGEFGPLAAIVVRLTCAAHPWPARSSHAGLEHAAALHLAGELARGDKRPRALAEKARRLMRGAITAYVDARAKRAAS